MKRVTLNNKRVNVGDFYGRKYSNTERNWNEKHNIWQPENTDMNFSTEKPITFAEFERKLKELNTRFYVVFNKKPHDIFAPAGHAIRFRDLTLPEGFDIVDGVGKTGEKMISANSEFANVFDPLTMKYVTRFISKGYSEALNTAKIFLIKRGLAKIG